MSESDVKFREEVDVLLEEIDSFCKLTLRTIQVSTEEKVRKDIVYTCGKLIPEISNMIRVIVMKNTELVVTNEVLLDLCETYREGLEDDDES